MWSVITVRCCPQPMSSQYEAGRSGGDGAPVRRVGDIAERYRAPMDGLPQSGDRYAQAFTVEPGQWFSAPHCLADFDCSPKSPDQVISGMRPMGINTTHLRQVAMTRCA